MMLFRIRNGSWKPTMGKDNQAKNISFAEVKTEVEAEVIIEDKIFDSSKCEATGQCASLH